MSRLWGMESDAFYRGGTDVEGVERAMHATIAEVRGTGGGVPNASCAVVTAGDEPRACFDDRLPPDRIGAEVEFDPDSVEDRGEE